MSIVKLIHNNRALGKGDDDTYSVEMSMVSLNFSQSGFPVRSVETGLEGYTLVLAVISVDAIVFWLSQTRPVTLRIQE